MNAPRSTHRFPSPAAPASGRSSIFSAAGFKRIEPAILHPASIFLDMSGEAIRGRLFLTADAAGEELCLRPEYTIPVCRAYLASDKAGAVAEYSYLGPVFRAQAEGGGERAQTGLESFGRKDAEAADAEIFSLAMEAAAAAGGKLAARLGDAGLFDALLTALALPDVWRRRLKRGLAQGRDLAAILDGRGQSALAQPGVLAAMESADHAGARALVEDLLAIAGIDAVGGRSASEIADRFLEQAALRSGDAIGVEQRQALASYLAVSGDPDVAADKLRDLAASAGLDLGAGARRLRAPQRLYRRPRRRDRGDALFRRLRARLRLLHRLRVRGPRPGPCRRAARARGWPLRRSCAETRGRTRTFPRSARRLRSTGCGSEGAR